MNITVVGLGKIGLPLAVQYAKKGHNVFGADINQETVELVNRGVEPFPNEKNLQLFLAEVISDRRLTASVSTSECVSKSDAVVVVVPLFVNSKAEPDFAALDAVTSEIAEGLKPGTLVSYETTLPVGTTRNRFSKALEVRSGLKAGSDFHLVFSPERVLTGRIFEDLKKYPKIVGGITTNCAKAGRLFYEAVLDFNERQDLPKPNGVWEMDSAESAEFVKLAETTYRDVNIGLANQFAKFADKLNLNIYSIIESANSQPFSNLHNPGIAVGGHCIPVYPQLYLWEDPSATCIVAARLANEEMPNYAITQIEKKLGSVKDKKVLVLGVSYREGVKEVAFSGAFELQKQLESRNAIVHFFDPSFSKEELRLHGFTSIEKYDADYEILIIQTHTPSFREYITKHFSGKNIQLIYDGRNLLEGKNPLENCELMTLGMNSRENH